MAALTADRDTHERVAEVRTFVAGATIYAGALVALNASGKAVPASDTANLTVVGVAQFPAASGEYVNVKSGCFAFDASGITNAAIGSIVYVSDDHTVASSSTNSIAAGEVFEVDDDGVWVITGRAYAPVGHNHSGVYALADHNHSGVYAAADHNHDGVYALVDHNHDGV